jgi:hypothetical protein
MANQGNLPGEDYQSQPPRVVDSRKTREEG